MKLSISNAWTDAGRFLASEGRLVWPVALALFALPATISAWLSPGMAQGGPSLMPLILMLVVMVAGLMGQLAISGLAMGWSGSVGEAVSHAFRRLWSYLGAVLIAIIPLVLLLLLGLALVVGNLKVTDPAQLTPEFLAQQPSFGLVTLAFFFCLIAVFARLFLMSAVSFREGGGPIQLLKRSLDLSRGHFWRLFGLLLLFLILSIFLGGAVRIVIGSLIQLASGPLVAMSLPTLLLALASALVSAFLTTALAALVGKIYLQLTSHPSVPSTAH